MLEIMFPYGTFSVVCECSALYIFQLLFIVFSPKLVLQKFKTTFARPKQPTHLYCSCHTFCFIKVCVELSVLGHLF